MIYIKRNFSTLWLPKKKINKINICNFSLFFARFFFKMATSRLEKIGTIYSRITGLLRSEALKVSNKPIWYDIYQNFPPKYTPKYDRPVPNTELREIFYPEDTIRSQFSRERGVSRNAVNLLNNERPSDSQKCIAYYEEFKKEITNEEEVFKKAMEKLASEMPTKKESSFTPFTANIANDFKKSKGIIVSDFLTK